MAIRLFDSLQSAPSPIDPNAGVGLGLAAVVQLAQAVHFDIRGRRKYVRRPRRGMTIVAGYQRLEPYYQRNCDTHEAPTALAHLTDDRRRLVHPKAGDTRS